MKSSKWLLTILAVITVMYAAGATAATLDANDPRRALGREDDIRIDAQLLADSVSPGTAIGITCQIQNLSRAAVAVAEKVSDSSYDPDTRTITISIGSEVPKDGVLPRLTIIAPGETKTFSTGGVPRLPAGSGRGFAPPRFVQIKVNVLRNLAPFREAIDQQSRTSRAFALTDAQFDSWLEGNAAILLNALPVRFSPRNKMAVADAAERGGRGRW